MTIALSALFSLATYVVLTQRSLLGVLVGVQLFFTGFVLALVLMVHPGASPELVERTQAMALLVTVFAHIQALVGLGFAVRLHLLRSRADMGELSRMRH